MMRAYFLSDIHLGSNQDPKFFLLTHWLKSFVSVEQMTHLFLLGDIFDLWVHNYQHFTHEFQELIQELIRLKYLGVEIHYFEGNHDLHLEAYWQRELHIPVYKGPQHFQLGSLNIRLEHGDQMDPEDRGYIFLRWLLRTPVVKWCIRHLPEKFMVWLGESSSRKSRSYTTKIKTINKERAIHVIRTHAQKIFQSHPFDIIITGHMHVRDEFQWQEESKTITSMNLGSWLDHPQVLLLEEGGQISFVTPQ